MNNDTILKNYAGPVEVVLNLHNPSDHNKINPNPRAKFLIGQRCIS